MAEFATMIKEVYNVKCKLITIHNPAANAIVDHVHQTIGTEYGYFSQGIFEDWHPPGYIICYTQYRPYYSTCNTNATGIR